MVQIADDFRSGFSDLADWIMARLRQVPDHTYLWNSFRTYAQIDSEARARSVLNDSVLGPVLRLAKLDTDTLLINGQFRTDEPDSIYICSEIANHSADLGRNPDCDLLVESTILHELVHWGNFRAGDIDRGNPNVEWGKAFEIDVYGKDVDRYWLPAGQCAACGTARAVYDAGHGTFDDVAGGRAYDPPTAPGGAPLARSNAAIRVWPIQTLEKSKYVISYLGLSKKQFGDPQRSFFALRTGHAGDSIIDNRHHVGVDLYAVPGDAVVACEAGEIVNIHPFLEDTMALLVHCDSGIVINYGEIARDSWGSLGIGSRVAAGTPIARVGRSSHGGMCHFETYTRETRQTARWKWNGPRPENILNPTRYLLDLPRP